MIAADWVAAVSAIWVAGASTIVLPLLHRLHVVTTSHVSTQMDILRLQEQTKSIQDQIRSMEVMLDRLNTSVNRTIEASLVLEQRVISMERRP